MFGKPCRLSIFEYKSSWHRLSVSPQFEEFNLRFYVLRKEGNSYKRGVVFVKEIVPRRMITFVAYWLYGEKYYYHRMKNSLKETESNLEVKYSFLVNKKWNYIQATADNKKKLLPAGTEQEFITEHYWGYTKLANGDTSEYSVQHPQWNLYNVTDYNVDVNAVTLYGEQWHPCLSAQPTSVFMADGSPVVIFTRNVIK